MRIRNLAVAVIAAMPALAGAQEIEQTTGLRLLRPERSSPYCCPAPSPPPAAQPPQTSPTEPPASDAFRDAFASTGEGGTMGAESYAPAMFGDLIGKFGTRFMSVGGSSIPGTRRLPILATSGGIKIADGESPRPQDRIYYQYHFFANTNVDVDPTVPPIGVHRHMLGFEKTLFGQNLSVGLRLPWVNMVGYPEATQSAFADLSVLIKLAIVNNPQTGNVIATGVSLTPPTGPPYVLTDVRPGRNPTTVVFHPMQIQPYLGYVLNSASGRAYVHGFTSLLVPTDPRDVTLFFNDIGVGYWLYRNNGIGYLRGIVPTLEVHVNTPLNHVGAFQSPIGFPHIVNLTTGGYIVLARSLFGGAVGIPISTPRPFSVEAVATYSLRF